VVPVVWVVIDGVEEQAVVRWIDAKVGVAEQRAHCCEAGLSVFFAFGCRFAEVTVEIGKGRGRIHGISNKAYM
jgi:hypothetical protein